MDNTNFKKKYKRIQEQFEQMLHEKTESGVSPSSANVVAKLAELWCMNEKRIREILNMELEPDNQTNLFE
jgi:hypothetical protein